MKELDRLKQKIASEHGLKESTHRISSQGSVVMAAASVLFGLIALGAAAGAYVSAPLPVALILAVMALIFAIIGSGLDDRPGQVLCKRLRRVGIAIGLAALSTACIRLAFDLPLPLDLRF